MTPYYMDDAVAIYHADARELTVCADALITDPPYGVGLVAKATKFGVSRNRASVLYQDDPDFVRELIRDVIPRYLAVVERALIFSGTRMMWNYPPPAAVGGVFNPNGAGRCSWGFSLVHPILFYGRDPFLADGQGGRPNGFRDEVANPESFDHPCPKPVKWMRWAVARATRPGEAIVDPFMGTGTTLRAAKDLGRRAVGVEIEERYCEIAATRMGQEVLDIEGALEPIHPEQLVLA